MTSFLCRERSDLDEIWQTGEEWLVDCGDMVEIETGSIIPIWWRYISAVGWVITTTFGLLIETSKKRYIRRSEIGSKIMPQRPPTSKSISYLRWGWTDLDKIRQPNAEWHAEYGDMVKIKTGSRIPTWRTRGVDLGGNVGGGLRRIPSLAPFPPPPPSSPPSYPPFPSPPLEIGPL